MLNMRRTLTLYRHIAASNLPRTNRRCAHQALNRCLCTQPQAANDTSGSGVVSSASSMSPRVATLVDDLVSLNMLEVKELTSALKTRLGIDDSMIMPMSFNPGAMPGMAPAGSADAETKEKEPEKTHFDLKLEKFDAGKKIAVIKEIRAITGLGLKEAKALVEEAPKVFKNEVAKDEAEQLRDKLKDIGADVSLE